MRPPLQSPPRRPAVATRGDSPFRADLGRSVRLFGAFRKEQTDPGTSTACWRTTGGPAAPRTRASTCKGGRCRRRRGVLLHRASCGGRQGHCVDVDAGEMACGPARRRPVRSWGAHCSCRCDRPRRRVLLLERPRARPGSLPMAEEMVRVTRPGGTVFLSFTDWLSPWGGHETSPWHYLGGHWAARRYEREQGRRPKNVYGEDDVRRLGRCHAWMGAPADGRRRRGHAPALPAAWARPVVRVPGIREFVTWNLVLVLRRR